VIGYDVSEHLDLEPAKYFVVVTKREKRACQHCQEGRAAPGSGTDHRKGLVSDRDGDPYGGRKIQDHLPLYRQSAILEREAASRSAGRPWTMVMRVGELLIPIGNDARTYSAADTFRPMKRRWNVQMHDGRAESSGLRMAIRQTGRRVVFHFAWGGRDGPKEFLGQFEGICRPTAMCL